MNNEDYYNKLAFVSSSKIRKDVLVLLNKINVLTPTAIKIKLNKSLSEVSRVLGELKDWKLVECVNPTMKVSRFYKITESGKKILE